MRPTNKRTTKVFRAAESTVPTIARYAVLMKNFTRIIPTRGMITTDIISRSAGGVTDTDATPSSVSEWHFSSKRIFTVSKKLIVALMGLASIAAMSTAAFAHPKLMSSIPAENAMIAAGPSELRLTFNEKLEPSMSGVEVKDQSGKKIETGKAATDPADAKLLVIPLSAPLGDGTYNVNWHAVAADTHRIKGSYAFTVKH